MPKRLPTLPEGASAAERYFSERYPGYRLKDYRTAPLPHTEYGQSVQRRLLSLLGCSCRMIRSGPPRL